MERNNTLDIFKFLAAVLVVSLHVGYYPELGGIYGELIRLSGRWAVPFFFMVTGYFIGKEFELSLNAKIPRLIKLFIISSVIYLPAMFYHSSFDLTIFNNKFLSFEIFKIGTYFHLWYLSSLILGLIIFKTLVDYSSRYIIVIICTLLIFIHYYFDLTKSHNNEFSRHLLSVPCLFLGAYISRLNYTKCNAYLVYVSMFVCFLFLMIEPFITNFPESRSILSREFPIAVIPLCSLILIFSKKVIIPDNIFSKMGREYSLSIYLLHPLILLFVFKVLAVINYSSSLIAFFAGLGTTLIFSMLLKSKFKKFHNLLNGK